MTRWQRGVRVFILCAVVLLGVSAWTCDTGQDSHPNAPQVRGPERGGPPVPPPRNPSPAPGDPKPHEPSPSTSKSEEPMRDIKVTVNFDGKDRAIRVKWRANDRDRVETVKGTKAANNTASWPDQAPVGSTVTVTAWGQGDKDVKGHVMVWVDAANPEGTVCTSVLQPATPASCTGIVPKTK